MNEIYSKNKYWIIEEKGHSDIRVFGKLFLNHYSAYKYLNNLGFTRIDDAVFINKKTNIRYTIRMLDVEE